MVTTGDPGHDDLLVWRKEFPALEGCVHLISHSLGAMPARAATALREMTDLWAAKSITAWDDWLPEVDRAAGRIARLLGAPPDTVIMNQNVSTIEAMLASCFDYGPERNEIVYDDHNFPSVSYVWKAEERRGARCVVVRSDEGAPAARLEAILAAITERTLVVPISHVNFRTAYIQDAKKIIARAHEVGAVVILDTYQSLGTIPVDVVDLDTDFACGGSVKWLCGGPGAAYLYVKKELIPRFAPRVTGWFGHEHPFAFTMPEQVYASNVWRYIGGTPAVASLYQARAGAEIIGEVGVPRIRAKSLRQTQKLIDLVSANGFTLRSPRDASVRGGSVVFDLPEAGPVAAELNRRKFFCDYRPGAGIRVAPHFYTRDDELDAFFDEIARIRKANPLR
jgi:kynureninase